MSAKRAHVYSCVVAGSFEYGVGAWVQEPANIFEADWLVESAPRISSREHATGFHSNQRLDSTFCSQGRYRAFDGGSGHNGITGSGGALSDCILQKLGRCLSTGYTNNSLNLLYLPICAYQQDRCAPQKLDSLFDLPIEAQPVDAVA
jgi:hypothetical protein